MKIAIHKSGGFSDRWINYCQKNNIDYKIVNAYDSDIIKQLADCDAFMWHHSHLSYKDALFAKQLLFSLQQAGKKVFPDFNTGWYFDDKVGEKYLLEAIGAPLVPSYVFYTKKEAIKWIESTTFPKVFKLRGGAGSTNVMLIKNKKEAKKNIRKAFVKGFLYYNPNVYLKDAIKKFKEHKVSKIDIVKAIVHFFYPPRIISLHPKEKGYAYFQDFIPNNRFDIRVCVVGDRAFALKRLCRRGDFRASGGGNIVYHKNDIDERCIKIAFDVNDKIKSQSIAFDFVFDKKNTPLIVEISYGYAVAAYDCCEGYWTNDMQWHNGNNFDFCGWMVDNLIK